MCQSDLSSEPILVYSSPLWRPQHLCRPLAKERNVGDVNHDDITIFPHCLDTEMHYFSQISKAYQNNIFSKPF